MARSTTRIVQPLGKGQITIPIAMRRALGITDSSLLQLKLIGDVIVISKLAVESEHEPRIYTDEEIAQFFEDDRLSPELADWARRRLGGRIL
jgi:bifunctional DNA-binding transcriptional regulator/antitoxin component of YhaV-PrlF toxin-antitoxin module